MLLEFGACHIIVMYQNIWKSLAYDHEYLNICAALSALNRNALDWYLSSSCLVTRNEAMLDQLQLLATCFFLVGSVEWSVRRSIRQQTRRCVNVQFFWQLSQSAQHSSTNNLLGIISMWECQNHLHPSSSWLPHHSHPDGEEYWSTSQGTWHLRGESHPLQCDCKAQNVSSGSFPDPLKDQWIIPVGLVTLQGRRTSLHWKWP